MLRTPALRRLRQGSLELKVTWQVCVQLGLHETLSQTKQNPLHSQISAPKLLQYGPDKKTNLTFKENYYFTNSTFFFLSWCWGSSSGHAQAKYSPMSNITQLIPNNGEKVTELTMEWMKHCFKQPWIWKIYPPTACCSHPPLLHSHLHHPLVERSHLLRRHQIPSRLSLLKEERERMMRWGSQTDF